MTNDQALVLRYPPLRIFRYSEITFKDGVTNISMDGERVGSIDVLVNKAGYGAYGVLEATAVKTIRQRFETNVVGMFAVNQAFVPGFRLRASGVIVNVSSIGGRLTLPLSALYSGSKFAVEGISEAPVVAEVIYTAAAAGTDQLLYTAGEDAKHLAARSDTQYDSTFFRGLARTLQALNHALSLESLFSHVNADFGCRLALRGVFDEVPHTCARGTHSGWRSRSSRPRPASRQRPGEAFRIERVVRHSRTAGAGGVWRVSGSLTRGVCNNSVSDFYRDRPGSLRNAFLFWGSEHVIQSAAALGHSMKTGEASLVRVFDESFGIECAASRKRTNCSTVRLPGPR